MSKVDLRYQRSRQKLNQAFFELLGSGVPYGTQTVAMITKAAGVTRGTFYLHYRDKNDFYRQLLRFVKRDFFEVVIDHVTDSLGIRYPVLNLRHLLRYMADHRQEYLLLIAGPNPAMIEHGQHHLIKYLRAYAQAKDLPDRLDGMGIGLVMQYLAASHMGMVAEWLQQGKSYDIDTMVQLFHQMNPDEKSELSWFNDFFVS